MTIGLSKTSVSERPHRVTLQNPGPAVPDGRGGFTQTWTDLTPAAVSVKIEAATAEELERVAPGTVISTETHIVSGPYHPQVTTKTRILYNGRVFHVTGVTDPEERHVEMIAVAVEVVT